MVPRSFLLNQHDYCISMHVLPGVSMTSKKCKMIYSKKKYAYMLSSFPKFIINSSINVHTPIMFVGFFAVFIDDKANKSANVRKEFSHTLLGIAFISEMVLLDGTKKIVIMCRKCGTDHQKLSKVNVDKK